MYNIAYTGLLITGGLFIGFFSGMIIAAIMDWNYRRKNRVLLELQRTDYNRRPAAK